MSAAIQSAVSSRLRGAPSRAATATHARSDVAATRSLPKRIRVDNGTEFTSKALDHWTYWNGVELDFSRPAKPVDKDASRVL